MKPHMSRLAFSLALGLIFMAIGYGGEVGFIEDFALAKDRAAALKLLIPGTEDYYYYHCLHYLQTEQYQKAEEMTRPWLERFGRTGRLLEIQARHALLTYEQNPQRSLNYLRDRLGLQFNHQREVLGAAPNLPTALDPAVISRQRLLAFSLSNWRNLDNFTDSAFDWLAAENLNWEQRRNLLQRLTRPDLANLPQLIVADLAAEHAQPFGSYPIHGLLTLAQLQELARLRPQLLNETPFVNAWLARLQPGADEAWQQDPKLTLAYLERLWAFVSRLAPVHNSLKAHVLYHRLAFDRSQGQYDKARFLEYLKLPRHLGYMAPRWLERQEARQYPVDLNANYQPVTLLAPVGNDEPLVREFLIEFLTKAEAPAEFASYIESNYLRHLFAEAKILAGLGEPEQWASNLPPEQFRALKERVDIDFAATSTVYFGADQPVKLDVFLKNTPTLIVKVFEINTSSWYREQKREVNTDINLDGLVANEEQTLTLTEPPLRRFKKSFDFPKLTKPGVYVVDFIGGGRSSRALIRKGKLRPLAMTGAAGVKVRVVDDANRRVPDAKLWLNGQEYAADKDGVITVPFSTQPGRQPIVLSQGDFSCLEFLDHPAENYHLTVGFHVEREELLAQKTAELLVRPGLFLNGSPTSLKLLEDVRLRIISRDQDGVASTADIPDFKLFEDRESTHEFRVPARLASLTVELRAKVKSLTLGRDVELAAARSFALNGIDKSDKTEDLHLAKFGADWVIELLGRTGEAKPDRPVQLTLKHRDFQQLVNVTLKSDAQGRVKLGPLVDIEAVSATGPEGINHTWPIPKNQHSYRQLLHAKAGDVISLPYLGSEPQPTRAEFALFEVRGGVIRADRFDALKIAGGMLELHGLVPGDYDLWLKRENARIRIRVTAGTPQDGFLLGKLRQLELPGLKPIQVSGLSFEGDKLVVKLKDASPFARVHVFAVRYRPEFSAFNDLAVVRDRELTGYYPAAAEATYLTGRNIGDEFRYVLDRRGMKRFPGNMLERPALLLNPWAVRSTETGEQEAQGGDDFKPKAPPPPSMAVPSPEAADSAATGRGAAAAITSNLDFLADAAAVGTNLVPDKDGVIRLDRKEVGPHAYIHVIAVDPLSTTSRSFTQPEQPAKFVDLRLAQGLDPKAHFTLQKQITVLGAGQTFNLADITSSRFEHYDSLAKVYNLFSTLSNDPKLAEFSFLTRWPSLKIEEKRKFYSQFACHELSFFLMKKDPEFFKAVILPYLANKKDKTFLDRWLLGEDLKEYLDPWRYGRLNTVERILLAQRLPGEAEQTARHLRDLLRLLPPNVDRQLMLFDTAVQAGGLEAGVKFAEAKGAQEELKKRTLRENARDGADPREAAPATDMPSYPGAPGPAGGGGGMGGRAPGAPRMRGGMDSKSESRREGATRGKEVYKGDEAEKDRSTNKPEDKAGEAGGKAYHLGLEQERAQSALRQLYRKVAQTMEYAENNYYKLLIQQQVAELVPVSAFWQDYAQAKEGAFLSKNFADASRNFTEMMFALAVLDLPFTPAKHEMKFDGIKMTFTPAGPTIIFHEEVKLAAAAPAKAGVLLSQNFYRHGDRYREENGEKYDNFVTGEYLRQVVYGCQVVVTNPTSSRQKLSVLVQIPVGSLPLAGAQTTRTVMMDLEPYRTQTLDYLFYFPLPGEFAQFPVHVAKNEQFLAAAEPATFTVVARPSKEDTQSWDWLSQNGTDEQVLDRLARENLHSLNLDKIAFRMQNRAFFEKVTKLLRDRHTFQGTLWSYSFVHNSLPELREFLRHADQLVAECGNGPLVSAPLVIDVVARFLYEHLEYKPLVNARAHALGQQRQIVNDRFFNQYQQFLRMLAFKKQLDDADRLALVYYLLLQDRIEEALANFAQVDAAKVPTALQYDYCAGYLALHTEDLPKARAVAIKHANHPVDRWRLAFAALAQQLDEIEGKGSAVANPEDQAQRQAHLAATEPSFEFTIDGKAIKLRSQNLKTVRVNYYLMDVELLFSRNPFVQQQGGQFAAIRPNQTQEVEVKDGGPQSIPLPEGLVSRNVLVEVVAGGKSRTAPYYAGALDVRLLENYGQVQVIDSGTGKPLPKAYVKVYVRLADGQVKFHKDGYTDLRGRFDYASVSTPERIGIQRFAILVLSDEKGAQIREAAPPAQ